MVEIVFTAFVLLPLVLVLIFIGEAVYRFFFGAVLPDDPYDTPRPVGPPPLALEPPPAAAPAPAPAREPEPAPRPVPMATTKACPSCGQPVVVGSPSCGTCGREFRTRAAAAPA